MRQTLDIWRPEWPVFIRRSAYVAAPTVAFFALFSALTGLWQIALIGCALILIYFFFNDFLTWRGLRSDRWELTETALIYHGADGESQMALADVSDATTRFGWTVIVTQKNGFSVEMVYVRNPKLIAHRILATRAGLMP